ncbi:MAG TPA: hypothetical protein VGD54_04750, partial [Steroidobacteraceae bacterium]
MSFGGADWITINATGPDLGSPAPFDGVIDTNHHRGAGRHQGRDQHAQQLARHGAPSPRRPVEDAMEGAEVGIVLSTQDAQHRCDGVSTGHQDSAREQQWDVRPGRSGEQFGKPGNSRQKAGRQRRTGRVGDGTGVLHPNDRISAPNRGNIAALRQIESAVL